MDRSGVAVEGMGKLAIELYHVDHSFFELREKILANTPLIVLVLEKLKFEYMYINAMLA